MQREEILQQLGLTPATTQVEIREAIAAKREQLHSKQASAPTDALKTKYQTLLDQLAQAEKILAEPVANKSRFSQTQLDDMPQSATQFEGGNQAQINIAVGTVLAGRYEIKEQIGAGGMGAVYRANDKNTGDDIALKVLLPALMQNERARERFLNEARISQKLSHPNIVNVFDVQQDGDLFFLTMELLKGQDLRQAMDNRKLARQAFAVDEVIEIAKAISTGLNYAHRFTIHRDIKPENIWLADNGDIKIMDFGIAQVQSTSQRTKTGAAMGTAYYMAPEQLRGAKDIDGRADQYALAVMVYELLSGEVPAGMIEPLQSHRRDIPKALAEAVHKALATKPENRFETLEGFIAALSSKRGGTNLPSLPWPKLGVAAGILVAVIGVGALASGGALNLSALKGLLPQSQEEINQQKAELAKLQGQINVTKKRLEEGRRKLENEVRDAERDKTNTSRLAELSHWQTLTESALFNGNQITELEGELAMAEAHARDNTYILAKTSYEKVLAGYAGIQTEFNAAEKLFNAEVIANNAKQKWLSAKSKYDLDETLFAAQAVDINTLVLSEVNQGNFNSALSKWDEYRVGWQSALNSASEQMAAIEKRWAQEKAVADEKRRIALEKKRLEDEAESKRKALALEAENAKKRELERVRNEEIAAEKERIRKKELAEDREREERAERRRQRAEDAERERRERAYRTTPQQSAPQRFEPITMPQRSVYTLPGAQ